MIFLIAIAAITGLYQLAAILACVSQKNQNSGFRLQNAPVSILKPVHGMDPGLSEAIASHANLEGEFELLCGVSSMDDPALAVLREFPRARVVECRTKTPNRKAGVLMDLAAQARYPILLVNDADIRVPRDYLARVTAPLTDPTVGLVTCLYRPSAETFAARFEGLGISTDFAPSTLVARMVGVDEFALGSTLAFRRKDLDRIGGFQTIADYLADDYQLGHRLHGLGLKCVLSDVIVDTNLGGGWKSVWLHQVRWARTIRVSKPGGYIGLPLTFATLWAVLCAATGEWRIAVAIMTMRMAMATMSGWFVIRSRDALRLWWAVPVRDLFSAAVWVAGLFGNSVLWRGQRLRLDWEGRIITPPNAN